MTSSLSQFCVQFGSYMLILYMLETLFRLGVDNGYKETVNLHRDNNYSEVVEELADKLRLGWRIVNQ